MGPTLSEASPASPRDKRAPLEHPFRMAFAPARLSASGVNMRLYRSSVHGEPGAGFSSGPIEFLRSRSVPRPSL